MAMGKEDIVKELSDKDLKELLEAVQKEIEQRDINRFNDITNEIMRLLKKLQNEFRYVSAEIAVERDDDDDGTLTVDIMHYVEDIYFSR